MITKAVIRKEIERTERKYSFVLNDEDYDDPETSAWVNGYLEALYFLINNRLKK